MDGDAAVFPNKLRHGCDTSRPFTLGGTVRLVIAVLLALTVTLDAQAPPQEFEVAPVTPSPQSSGPLFEVVSIKPAGSPTLPPIIASMLLVRSRRVQAQAITAAKLLAAAFPVD